MDNHCNRVSYSNASLSSDGGIGGGRLYVPILTIIASVDLKTASSFSAFMVTGGSIGNVVCNICVTSPKNGGKILIDFDIAFLSKPRMLLGVSIGVICTKVLPEWLITILFAVFLVFCTFRTCKLGFFYWKLESELENKNQELENGLMKN
ncbi:putative cysteine-rich receptor-like protein kinase 6-like [Capsicum annuum]|nr:putative cysteine-rich receptor-like protein kinase 6-like [Capsicum annuum]